MNEHVDFERLVAETSRTRVVSRHLTMFYDEPSSALRRSAAAARVARAHQGAPHENNSHLSVGSPTARVAAIMVATVMLALALAATGAGVQQLLAADTTDRRSR